MNGFKNVNAYINGKGIINCDISILKGKINEIGNNLNISSPLLIEKEDIVVPGFIDEHVHGAGGADAMDGKISSLETITKCLCKEGTTTFLATTMTQSIENITKANECIKTFREKNNSFGAEILGIHLEGPFISKLHIGAQPEKYVISPDIKTFQMLNEKSGNCIKIVSLAPEEPNAIKFINYLNDFHIVASAGHTDASYNKICEAIENGLKCVTHTFNAQKGIHHRDLGTAGAALLENSLYTEMICDLIHLSIPAIKLIYKNKPKNKIILITDSMRAKWLGEGESELGGQKVFVKNGEARLSNGALAGSILKMNEAIKNLVLSCNVPFEDAIDFATINPATNLNIENKKGSIKVGLDADFCVLNKDFEVKYTIRNGNIIFSK